MSYLNRYISLKVFLQLLNLEVKNWAQDNTNLAENKKYRVFPLLAPTCHKDRTTVLRTEKGKQEHAEHKTLFGMPGMRLQKSLLTWGNAGDCFRDSNKEEVGVSQLAAQMVL